MTKHISSLQNARANSFSASFLSASAAQPMSSPPVGVPLAAQRMTPDRLSAIINEALDLIESDDDFSFSGDEGS